MSYRLTAVFVLYYLFSINVLELFFCFSDDPRSNDAWRCVSQGLLGSVVRQGLFPRAHAQPPAAGLAPLFVFRYHAKGHCAVSACSCACSPARLESRRESRGSARVAQSPGAGRSRGSRSRPARPWSEAFFAGSGAGSLWSGRRGLRRSSRGGRVGDSCQGCKWASAFRPGSQWLGCGGHRWALAVREALLRCGQCSERLDVSFRTGFVQVVSPTRVPGHVTFRNTRPVVGGTWECTRGDPIIRLIRSTAYLRFLSVGFFPSVC